MYVKETDFQHKFWTRRICRVVSKGLAAVRKTNDPTAEFCVKKLRPRLCSQDGDLYGIYGEAMEVIELNSAGELGWRAH